MEAGSSDPKFTDKAGPILDLYQRIWEGARLGPTTTKFPQTKRPAFRLVAGNNRLCIPRRPTKAENEYFREGAWVYLATWDVHRAKVFGRWESQNGIAPVARLVAEVMGQEPYKSARRLFWIMDNRSAHRGLKAVDRFRAQRPNAILVHTPVHASWLNQIEIYFSIVQRKILTPSDFSSLAELERRLMAFQPL
jgi:hypothetical protein